MEELFSRIYDFLIRELKAEITRKEGFVKSFREFTYNDFHKTHVRTINFSWQFYADWECFWVNMNELHPAKSAETYSKIKLINEQLKPYYEEYIKLLDTL